MRPQDILKYVQRRPFQTFRLSLSDGRSFEVRHPEMLMISRTILVLAIHKPRARRPESFVFCDPVHIIRIEPVGNGRPRARQSSRR